MHDSATAEHWDWLWATPVPAWDPTSEDILQVIRRHAGHLKDQHILETGSGSGRISLRLAQCGAMVSLVDFSSRALALSRAAFAAAGQRARFHEASIMSMPFADASFDVVWNAGVLEHYAPADQARALAEAARVTRPGGLVIAICPYARSTFYRLGKYALERSGRWSYGREDPVLSMRQPGAAASLTLEAEYDFSWSAALTYLGLTPGGQPLLRLLTAWLAEAPQEAATVITGYLLASVFRTPGGNRQADEPAGQCPEVAAPSRALGLGG